MKRLPNGVKTLSPPVSASLKNVVQWTDRAVETTQKIRNATAAAQAAPLVHELEGLTKNINEGLQQAKTSMDLMMKGEGLENTPR